MKVTHPARVHSSTLTLLNRPAFIKDVALFEGEEVMITMEVRKKKRSLPQNKYWFAVVVPLVRQALIDVGYKLSLEQTHEYLKQTFMMGEVANEVTGEFIKIPRSSTELSTAEFAEVVEEVVRWAAEYLGVEIPLPNEQTSIF